MASGGFLNAELSKKTSLFGLKLWVLIGTAVGAFIVIILIVMSIWLTSRRKSSSMLENIPMPQIPKVSKEIKEVKVEKVGAVNFSTSDGVLLTIRDKSSDRESEKVLVHVGMRRSTDVDNHSQGSSVLQQEIGGNSISGEEGNSGTLTVYRASFCYAINTASPLSGLPEVSHVGWGHWFTLRDLEVATNSFARENVLGEGGYGIVYKGQLANGTTVAVKNLLNNLKFRAEVEAIGHVRHKNLVPLFGYCMEGTHRMLVYEYVSNGNLDQWLHGAMRQQGFLTWEARMKVILGTVKAYVAPEYANTGLLNEKSDVYTFGVLLLETITGRDPIDYGRPADEVNLVEWLKMMVGYRRSEEVVDPNMDVKPTTRNPKRVLLVALRCLDADSEKRPKMGHVVRMLEEDEFPLCENRRSRASHARNSEVEDEENPIWQNTMEASASRDVDIHTRMGSH